MRRQALPLALGILAVLAAPSSADWSAGGEFIGPCWGNGVGLVWLRDLPGGDLAVIRQRMASGSDDMVLQRVSPTGELGSGWPANGVLGATVPATFDAWSHGFALDDSSCVWVIQMNTSSPDVGTRARWIGPDGTLHPATGSLQVFTPWDRVSAMAPAPGGVYVAAAGRLKRILRSGAAAPGWIATGIVTGSENFPCGLLPDGAGGVIWLTLLDASAKVRLQRYDATGVRNTDWPVDGLAPSDVVPNPFQADYSSDVKTHTPSLLPSGPTHFLAGWVSYDRKEVRLQRVSYTGVRDAAWPSSALLAASGDTALTAVSVLSDRAGGAYVTWYLRGLPRATHVRADGTFEPGLDAAGVPLLPEGASHQPQSLFLYGSIHVPTDVTPGGNLIFAWGEVTSSDFRVRWLRPDLTPDPCEPAEGRVVSPAIAYSVLRSVHADPVGGAYLAWNSPWENAPCCPTSPGLLYMTRILPSALADAPPGGLLPGRIRLSAPRPNPACDAIAFDLALTDDAPVRVELLDVAGRALRSRHVQGRGAHSLAFEELGALPPGLYFVRVLGPGGGESRRVAVSR